jgi:hypothetical protein
MTQARVGAWHFDNSFMLNQVVMVLIDVVYFFSNIIRVELVILLWSQCLVMGNETSYPVMELVPGNRQWTSIQ